jgi:hypothetical protein
LPKLSQRSPSAQRACPKAEVIGERVRAFNKCFVFIACIVLLYDMVYSKTIQRINSCDYRF